MSRSQSGKSSSTPSAALLSVFVVAEFRSLWAAELLSMVGDQLARVSLAVLVFGDTGSAALTGLAYGLTFVPSLLGAILLGGLGDRYPRRTVMVAADLARAVMIGVTALGGCPLWLVAALVAATTLLGGPFRGAQQAVLPDVLEGPRYVAGMSVRSITIQTAQLLGFIGGGTLVAASDASTGLAIDAATFLASAVILSVGLKPHRVSASSRSPFWGSIIQGAGQVFTDPELSHLLLLIWLAGFYIVPEALAAPYAHQLHGGAPAVGLLLASDPAGSVIGGIVLGKWIPETWSSGRFALLGVAAGAPLAACLFGPPLAVAMILFGLSGFCATGYTIHSTARFVRLLSDGSRAQGSGLLSAGLVAVQGLGAVLAGLLADQLDPSGTVAVFGLTGVGAATLLCIRSRRTAAAIADHRV